MFSVRVAETAISGGVSSAINVVVAGKMCWSNWRMRTSHVSNMDPSESCVPSSGLRRDKAPLEAVSGRAIFTTMGAILYAGLAAGVLGEKECP